MENKMTYYFNKWWIREPIFFLIVFFIYCSEIFYDPNYRLYYFSVLFLFLSLYVHAMVHRFFIIPIWLEKNQFGRFFLWTIILMCVFSYFISPMDAYFLGDIKQIEGYIEPTFTTYFLSSAESILVVGSITFFSKLYENEKRQNEAKELINQLEISQLRAQLNPHFLFNTLNNLYGVSLEEPQKIPDLLLQFSELARYFVESTKRDWVPLHEELLFIKSYVAIENERVSQRCEVRFSENIDHFFTQTAQIAPMLMIPLIENAFKHGTATIEKCFIDIQINQIGADELQMVVQNSMPVAVSKKIISTSTGIENTQKRLERLYPKTSFLKISQENNIFYAETRLKLS